MRTEKNRENKFVLLSSIFLTLGFVGFNLFEYTSNQNFNVNIQFIHLNLPYSQNSSLLLFTQLIIFISLSCTILTLICFYGIVNGIIIIFNEKKLSIQNLLLAEEFIFNTMILIFIISIFNILYYVLIAIPSIFIEYLFTSTNLLLRYGIRALLIIIYYFLISKNRIYSFIELLKKNPIKNYVFSSTYFMVIYTIISLHCYSLKVSTDKLNYSQKDKSNIDIQFVVGGATSDIKDAKIFLVDSKKDTTFLSPIINTNEALYFTSINSSELSLGECTVYLQYNHIHLSSLPPFISFNNTRKYSFLISL